MNDAGQAVVPADRPNDLRTKELSGEDRYVCNRRWQRRRFERLHQAALAALLRTVDVWRWLGLANVALVVAVRGYPALLASPWSRP